jgi:pyridoxal phosphate enzyme (YggS family)
MEANNAFDPADIARKAEAVRRNLAPVLEAVSLAPSPVRIVGITKYVDASWCCAAVDAGLTELGENRILEGAEKYAAVHAAGRSFTAHMVGPIQSNKAAKVPGAFDFVQALDGEKVAKMLDRRCAEMGISLDTLVEVNIDNEPQKSGVAPSEVAGLVEHVAEHNPRLRLRGIMVIPSAPLNDEATPESESDTRDSFRRARALYESLRKTHWKMDTLSMGMSADYKWAIEEGATMIRVGRLLWET